MTSGCLSPESALFKWAYSELLQRDLVAANDSLDFYAIGGDAGFRQYFRPSNSLDILLVLAPVETENTAGFIAIADFFRTVGIRVPKVFASNIELGFLIVEDLGLRAMLDVLDEVSVDSYYAEALLLLLRMQQQEKSEIFPVYTQEKLKEELNLFLSWFAEHLLELTIDKVERKMFAELSDSLVESALAQPKVIVHRDFHSRNLMILENDRNTMLHGIGLIDFQDAVLGPFSYDLASLLKDCYIQWPRERVLKWLLAYATMARDSGLLNENISSEQIIRDFDLMGLQRHLKVLGIFSRLQIRDKKNGYLKDIPRVYAYVEEIASLYSEFEVFNEFLVAKIKPALNKAQQAGIFS